MSDGREHLKLRRDDGWNGRTEQRRAEAAEREAGNQLSLEPVSQHDVQAALEPVGESIRRCSGVAAGLIDVSEEGLIDCRDS